MLVEKIDGLMGKMFEVEIIENGKFFMKGKIINKEEVLAAKVEKKPIIKIEANNSECCGGSCSCEHGDDATTNTFFNSKITYYAVFALSIAYLTRFTWKYFVQNK